MADDSFRVKNTLIVNSAFVANSTVVNAAAVNATSVNTATANATTSIVVGGNVSINTSTLAIGNSTVYTNTVAGQITISGTVVNSTIYQGTAFNANNLGGNPATFFTNATNISSGTLPMAQLGANVVNTSANFTITGTRVYSANVRVNANLTVNNANFTISNGNIVLSTNAGFSANGTVGTSGQVLLSNGTSAYWGASTVTVRQTFTATAGQTTFTVSGGYTPGVIDVYYNGVKLINGTEVTVSSGTNVVLATGAAAGATIDVVGLTATVIATPGAVAKTGDTMTGALALPTNGLVVGSTQLVATGGNIGIGTATPASTLDVNGVISQSGVPIVPPGVMLEYGGSAAPSGWLLCDGAAVNRTTYAALFAIIGTTYGAGDGVNTFNLPDRRGRYGIGSNATYPRGTTGGSLSTSGTALTINQMPSHTHTGTTSTVGDHIHGIDAVPRAGTGGGYTGVNGVGGTVTQTQAAGAHNHTFTTDATGGGQTHDHTILPPYVSSNYIIKT